MLKSVLHRVVFTIIIFASGMATGAIFFMPESSEALYGIPPTPAYREIILNDNVTTIDEVIVANSSSAILQIVSDGSIIIERGVGGQP